MKMQTEMDGTLEKTECRIIALRPLVLLVFPFLGVLRAHDPRISPLSFSFSFKESALYFGVENEIVKQRSYLTVWSQAPAPLGIRKQKGVA